MNTTSLLVAIAVAIGASGCLIETNPCGGARKPAAITSNGASSPISVERPDTFPSFKSDTAKTIEVDRKSGRVIVRYVHDGKRVVETWKMGPIQVTHF